MSEPDWRDSYLASLREAERDSPVNKDLVAACSALADRVAALEAEKGVLQLRLQQQQQQQQQQPSSAPISSSSDPATTTTTTTAKETTKPPSTAAAAAAAAPAATTETGTAVDAAQARLDLAEALRAKGALAARLRAAEEELRQLRERARADERRIRELTAERKALAARLKDRGEELAEKSRMVNRFQDDIVALTMELNLTEQKSKRVAAENKELVDRWMKRMGEEADAMNQQNEPILNNRR
ncbi:hypothetical protein DL766_004305 [Monosporascus sp. MC13-8B]|uniref:Autophagy-related protein 16 domain-containing protein n=1 Tax=Monosporascus cannonballus TaxID=155416 RepID=A0ABY0H1G8_9PEZI|nr:hypothetical protein DL763_008586 [Monosporascus cannonballus]RYO81653.1 hypothetical protein DL762_007003 [Monosporascus cannonballus]RYP31620.1 hypothetical protein DL766_004305 [Monosporascus sp. MC13-8B]